MRAMRLPLPRAGVVKLPESVQLGFAPNHQSFEDTSASSVASTNPVVRQQNMVFADLKAQAVRSLHYEVHVMNLSGD